MEFNLVTFVFSLLGMKDVILVPEAWNVISQVVMLFTAITIWQKSRSDNPFWDFVLKILNYLAGNVGGNKNAE